MGIRIYALAKELGMDNKAVLDLCEKAGLTGKGSALASLSDEEAQLVRNAAHAAVKKPVRAEEELPEAPIPLRHPGAVGRVPVLPTRSRKNVVVGSGEEASGTEKKSAPESDVRSSDSMTSDMKVSEVSLPEMGKMQDGGVSEGAEPGAKLESVPQVPRDSDSDMEKTGESSSGVVSGGEQKDKVESVTLAASTGTGIPEQPQIETLSPPEATAESEFSQKNPRVSPEGRDVIPTSFSQKKPSSGRAAVGESFPATRTGSSLHGRMSGKSGNVPPSKGSSPRTTPLGGRLGTREGGKGGGRGNRDDQRGSVTEQIAKAASQAEGPVRPAHLGEQGPLRKLGTPFPSLHPPRSLRHPQEEGSSEKLQRHKDKEETRPAIHLAPVPAAKMPVAKKREPVAQKPDMRLPLDVLRRPGNVAEFISEQEHQNSRGNKRSTSDGFGGKEREKDKERDLDRKKGKGGSRLSALDSVPEAPSKFKKSAKRGGRASDEAEDAVASRLQSKRRRGIQSQDRDEDEMTLVHRRRRMHRTGTNTAAPRKSSYVVQLPITVREFADEVGLTVSSVLAKLMELGAPTNINASLDETTVTVLAESLGLPVDIRQPETLETRLISSIENEPDALDELEWRPPIVTFLGHVDHGKTSLLDRIIGLNVVSGEKGGITQHIRAYNVKYEDQSVTFVDTPGHEAFTEMRARGANCTDIAVLVVAADDGVMPQTEEAISHARAAGVPIIVALNKMDLPGVDEQRALTDLASNDLLPSEWGGNVEVVRCSAMTGMGIETLMETILLVAELQEYKANPNRKAQGVCIECEVQQGRGVVAKMLVKNGTLHSGDVLVCGTTSGRVKAMYDTLKVHERYSQAGPSIPVNVTGLDEAPGAGDMFYVLDDIADARRLAAERASEERRQELAGTNTVHVTLENLFERIGENTDVQTLNIILRADVRGSIEAIRKELGKLQHDEVQIRILQATVGGITEADVHLADASDAIIIGFNVVPDEKARVLAEVKGVQIRRYDIIYQLSEDVRKSLEGMLKPEEHKKDLGRALVQRVFQITRVGSVAGCRVLSGIIKRDSHIRIIRDSRIIGDYALDTLKREKDDAKEVREGYECGIKLAGFNDIKDGDILEAYQVETVARTF